MADLDHQTTWINTGSNCSIIKRDGTIENSPSICVKTVLRKHQLNLHKDNTLIAEDIAPTSMNLISENYTDLTPTSMNLISEDFTDLTLNDNETSIEQSVQLGSIQISKALLQTNSRILTNSTPSVSLISIKPGPESPDLPSLNQPAPLSTDIEPLHRSAGQPPSLHRSTANPYSKRRSCSDLQRSEHENWRRKTS